MNKKLTFPELAELLSAATNTSKRMSELFLRELFAAIAQSLIEGESVKVKGLGVFKVGEVSSRKSIDVNTGKAIEIAGHKKITFTPDKSMAEAVNASFACFEAVVLDDDVTNEMIQEIDDELAAAASSAEAISEKETEEIVDENQELPEESSDEETVTLEVPIETTETVVTPPPFNISQVENEPATDEEPEQETEMPTEDPQSEPDVEVTELESPEEESGQEEKESAPEESEVETEESEHVDNQPTVQALAAMAQEQSKDGFERSNENSEELDNDEDNYDEYQHRRHRHHHHRSWYDRNRFGLGFMSGAFVGIAFAVAVLFYFDNQGYITISKNSFAKEQPIEEVVEIADTVATAAPGDTVAAVADSAKSEPSKPVAKPAVVTDTVRPGNFLSRMARRFYGNSHFWVYIYEENKAKITNPNNVAEGTVVVIPPAEKYGIDAQSPESVEKARKKEGEVLNAYK
ncbi:MAG: HU family DNA-binding protein [Muribaculaceae bacterium]